METECRARGRRAACALLPFLMLLFSAWLSCPPAPEPARTNFAMAAVHQSMEPQNASISSTDTVIQQRVSLPERLVPAGAFGAAAGWPVLPAAFFAGLAPGTAHCPGAATLVRMGVRLDE